MTPLTPPSSVRVDPNLLLSVALGEVQSVHSASATSSDWISVFPFLSFFLPFFQMVQAIWKSVFNLVSGPQSAAFIKQHFTLLPEKLSCGNVSIVLRRLFILFILVSHALSLSASFSMLPCSWLFLSPLPGYYPCCTRRRVRAALLL